MTPVRHVVYLHGFMSSPASSKAQRFASELRARGVTVARPDLNQPAFETLTVTRMLDQTAQAVAEAPAGPVALIGSSLGGFVALHAAPFAPVDRVILLAPAVEIGGPSRDRSFASLRRASPGPGTPGAPAAVFGVEGIAEWRRRGWIEVFHHAWDRPETIRYGLYEDAARFDAFAIPTGPPTLVFQGRRDDSVDPAGVVRWANGRPWVDLRLLDDGHQLTASLDRIWEESRVFLGLEDR